MTNYRKPKQITRHLQLEVTQEIIENATRRNSTACVLADALKIAIPGGVRPLVDLQTMSITVPAKGVRYHWLTPRSAQRLLINFDQGAALGEESVRLTQGWATPITPNSSVRRRRMSREDRLAELEAGEEAGVLTPHEKRALGVMRSTDAQRSAIETQPSDEAVTTRTRHGGRPPLASLTNANGRRYGLRLTKLTEHGQALIDE